MEKPSGQVRRTRAAAVVVAIACLAGGPALAGSTDCGFRGVSIEGTALERGRGCIALARVMEAFDRMGFRMRPKFSLVFKDQVFLGLTEGSRAAASPRLLPVWGWFDARHRLIEMTSLASPRRRFRHPWGLVWEPGIAESILHHELAHMASLAVMGDEYWRIGSAWLEFIAYGIEFEIMDPPLKRRILARHGGVEPFANDLQVNSILHAFDPDRFALRSHLMIEARGGLQFLRRVISGDVPFSRAEMLWKH